VVGDRLDDVSDGAAVGSVGGLDLVDWVRGVGQVDQAGAVGVDAIDVALERRVLAVEGDLQPGGREDGRDIGDGAFLLE